MPADIQLAVRELREAILAGDEEAARAATRAAFDELGDGDPMQLIAAAVQPALEDVGKRFRSEEIFLPELILAGDAARVATEIILPRLPVGAVVQKGVVILGSPRGDLHDIGKNIVGAMLRAYGYRVVDLGVDVPPQRLCQGGSARRGGYHCRFDVVVYVSSLPARDRSPPW